MFGHDDNQKEEPKDTTGVMPTMVPDPSATAGLADTSSPPSPAPAPAGGAPDVPPTAPGLVIPGTDSSVSSDSEEPASDEVSSPAADDTAPTEDKPADGGDSTTSEDSNGDSPVDDDLMGLKKEALQQLSPLVGKLDQTPEEKFRTLMMLIQASDDRTLVKTAFEAAQAITDDKTRAQALLDVINEINYFTQHKSE